MSLIVVSGLHRSGTSLIMQLIKEGGIDCIVDELEFEKKERMLKMQKFYNESTYLADGLTWKGIEKFEKNVCKEKPQCIKLFIQTLQTSLPSIFKQFNSIIIMVRNWRNQERSNRLLYEDNTKIMFKECEDEVVKYKVLSEGGIDKYIKNRRYPLGVKWGFYYTYFLLHIRFPQDNIKIITFENLLNNTDEIVDDLIQFGMNINKKTIVTNADKKQSKFSVIKHDDTEEFEKEFYKFLDLLYEKYANGTYYDTEFMNSVEYWYNKMCSQVSKVPAYDF
jgi:hypothetical protein